MTAIPAQRHSPTSVAAADEIAPHAGGQRAAVLAALRVLGELTDEQIAVHTGLNPSSARPRRIELVAAGRVVQAGTAVTSSGRKAATWRYVPEQLGLGL